MSDVTTSVEEDFEDDDVEIEYEDVAPSDNELDLDDLIDWSGFENLPIEGINLKVESPPVKPVKVRKVISKQPAWEDLFDGLRSHPGIFIRVALFTESQNGPDYRKKASARARNMRSRLQKSQPNELWIVETTEDNTAMSVKIFVSYAGPASPELRAERAAKYEAAKQRAMHAAASRNLTPPADTDEEV